MSRNAAIVVGHQGQDGRLLVHLLRSRGYDVLGVGRTCVESWGRPIDRMRCSLGDPDAVAAAVRCFEPDEIYYLAAAHSSSQGPTQSPSPEWTSAWAVNVQGLLYFLEAVRRHRPACRVFYASSSLTFGAEPLESPQTEHTPRNPDDAYSASKAHAEVLCRSYRQRYGLFVSVGILYNHESSLRPPDYLSTKLVRGAVSASRGDNSPVIVGSLDACADWGFAPDFVEAFTRILHIDTSEDFVVATGRLHTVRDFAEEAYGRVGLDWRRFVKVDAALLSRPPSRRVGDASKLRVHTGWKPSVDFRDMIHRLLDSAACCTVPYSP